MDEDPYQTLGLTRDASQDDIRRAYRRLAKQHHPDLNPGNKAAEDRFKKISAANELLSDPEKRARFDRGEIDASGQERPPPRPSYRDFAEGEAGSRYSGNFSAEDLQDIFGSMFGEGRFHEEAAARGRHERYALTVEFLDAVNGATRRLTLPDGRTLDVRIPAGTEEGQMLRLRGQGSPGPRGAPAGDALIEIHIAPHPFFERDGQDLRLELPVTLQEAVLGTPIEVPTPAGPVRMRIPAGSDSGKELRLKGRGVPAHNGLEAGHLYAKLRVMVGPPDKALEDFLRGWKPEHPFNPRQALGGAA